MKREYPRSAMRVTSKASGGPEIKWCENERSWLASLYEGREEVVKDSPNPEAMRAIMEGRTKGKKAPAEADQGGCSVP